MAAGEEIPPPHLDEEGEAYVDKVVGWLMDPKIRRRVFESGGKDPGYAKPWQNLKELYSSEEISAILGGARDSVVLDPLAVADLVRSTLIQGGLEEEAAELAQIGQGRGKIDGIPAPSSIGFAHTRSGCNAIAGGDDQIKIEALRRLGHGEYSPPSQVRPHSSSVEGSLGSGSPVAVAMIVGGDGTRSKLVKAFDRNVKVRPQPVCINASMSGSVPHADCGPNSSDDARSEVNVEVEKQNTEEGGDLVEMGSNEKMVEAMCRPDIGLVEASGSAISCADHMVPVADGVPPAGCDGPVCGDLPVCLNARVEAVALAQKFLPPAPGVGLQEWVNVAKDSRKGKKLMDIPNRVPAGNCSSSGIVPTVADPFPPLDRSYVDDAGTRVLAEPCGHDKLGNCSGGPASGVPEQHGVNKFSWQELLRTSKPAELGVDLHYVAPSMIDGEPCAVFTNEEEAANLQLWQHTLICYVVGKSPTYYQFLKTVNKLWKPSGGVEVFMRENGLFYCRFACEEEMNRTIKNGPWYMEGKLIVVKKFVGATNCEEDMLSCIPIWVKLPCLPVKWWSIAGVSKVVSVIGQPLYFDVPSASLSRIAYARCCVEVAMDRDLPSWINCIGGDKVRRRQKIEYDWVPKKCSNCKMFGHLVADCNLVMNKGVAKKVVEQGKLKGDEQVQNIPRGLQQSEWENPKGSKARTAHRGVKEQSKQHMGTQGPRSTMSMLNNNCAKATTNAFQLLLNIDEEDPGDALVGATLEKQTCLDGDAPSVQHINEDATDVGIEEEGSGNEQVAGTNKEGTHGMGGKEGIASPPCCEGGSEENDSGNQGEIDSMTMEDSDYTKSIKKKKRFRKKPAPFRPEGSRTTRHSGNIPTMYD